MMIDKEHVVGKIKRLREKDDNLKILKDLLRDKQNYDDYFLKGDVLFKLINNKELLVVPKSLQMEIIKQAREKGDIGIKKTKELLSSDYFISNIDEKIQR